MQGLERCCGETIANILHLIESDDPEEAETQLVAHLIPTFDIYYDQMVAIDPIHASHCLLHYIAFLEGPPNNRNDDEFGLLDYTLRYLDNLIEN